MNYNNSLVSNAEKGNYKNVLRLLNTQNKNPNAVSSNGNTALIVASAKGFYNIVELLIYRGANIEVTNNYGKTALMMAAYAGQVEIAKILIKHKKSTVQYYNDFNESALTEACSHGHEEIIKLLLNNRSKEEGMSSELYTAMIKISATNNVGVAKMLIEHGASVNKHPDLNESPLTMATFCNNIKIVIWLIDNGANIYEANCSGHMPIRVAIDNDHKEMVAILLFSKELIRDRLSLHSMHSQLMNIERNLRGWNLLMDSVKKGFFEMAKLLIHNGADVNGVAILNSRSYTALKIAAINGNVHLVKLLLMHRAHVNFRDSRGNTPLWCAARYGKLNVVKLLYYNGANLYYRNTQGSPTCLMVAFQNGHRDVVNWLNNRGNSYYRRTTRTTST